MTNSWGTSNQNQVAAVNEVFSIFYTSLLSYWVGEHIGANYNGLTIIRILELIRKEILS
jgi:hypothetical protein